MDPSGKILAVTSFSRDITEKKRAEAELKETKDYLEKLLSYANAPIIVWDPDNRITSFNHAFERLTGWRAETVLGQDLQILFPDASREESLAKIGRTLEGEQWESVEIPILQRSGGVRLVLWNSANIYGQGGRTLRATIAQGQDITERKEAEQKLKASLDEKEVLLKEIHHRVKNNLQIIASMLSLQLESIKEEADRVQLLESQNRVGTLALIHEKLYGSEDLARIPFDRYIADLASSLLRSYRELAPHVELDLDLEEVHLGIGTSIPLSLILHELVSNTMKHAFRERAKGRLAIGLRRLGKDRYQMTVLDDGIGLPEDLDVEGVKSLGFQLVSVLARQIGAEVQIRRQGGTEFRLTFEERP
jgi:PAS domain S-box-containing protein